MTIDWIHFTPWASLAGGVLIGLAVALLLLLNGRIAGISGIVGGLLGRPAAGDAGWRIAFLTGLLGAPLVYAAVAGLPAIRIDARMTTLVAAGVLVGIGTRCGAGCTSGHGVCGIARLSGRSFAATALVMAAGFAVVYLVRHLIGA